MATATSRLNDLNLNQWKKNIDATTKEVPAEPDNKIRWYIDEILEMAYWWNFRELLDEDLSQEGEVTAAKEGRMIAAASRWITAVKEGRRIAAAKAKEGRNVDVWSRRTMGGRGS